MDWLDRHRLDDVSYEEDHPYAAAATRMGTSDHGISWLIWVVLDSSGYYRRRERRRQQRQDPTS
jgi:hypothetical protein